jgi:hypothetical protein
MSIGLEQGDRVRLRGAFDDERLDQYSTENETATVLRCAVSVRGKRRCLVQFDRIDGAYGIYWLDTHRLEAETG